MASLTPPPSSDSQPNRLRQGFIALAEALLQSVAEVFPECDSTETASRLFAALVKGDAEREDEFIRQCATQLRKHATDLKERREGALFAVADALAVLRDLDLRGKWSDPGFTPESKEHLWQYLAALKTYAELYCAVPTGIMGKIEHVAGDIGDRLRSGDLNLAQMDIAGIGNELLGQLSQDELQNFESNLPSIYGCISEVANSVAAQAGRPDIDIAELMKTVVGSQGGGEGLDVAAVLQRVGSVLAPGGTGRRAQPGADQMLQAMQSMGPMLQQLQGAMAASGGDAARPADFTQFSPELLSTAMAALRGNMEAAAASRPGAAARALRDDAAAPEDGLPCASGHGAARGSGRRRVAARQA